MGASLGEDFMRSWLVIGSLLLVGIFPTTSIARDESKWQRLYCDGMELEKHLPSGGYVDCLSPEYAIEVDWSEHWAEAVGQNPPSPAHAENDSWACVDGVAEGLA